MNIMDIKNVYNDFIMYLDQINSGMMNSKCLEDVVSEINKKLEMRLIVDC